MSFTLPHRKLNIFLNIYFYLNFYFIAWDTMVVTVSWELCVKVVYIFKIPKWAWLGKCFELYSGKSITCIAFRIITITSPSFYFSSTFSLPKQRVYKRESEESSDMPVYDRAYRKARSVDSEDCAAEYDCSFSLLELAFGKYSTPPPGYYKQHWITWEQNWMI